MSFRSIAVVWRCVWVPRVLTLIGLVIGLPMYLAMPPWCDITLYDVAARNLLTGGVHYRDVFDTNPPGFVWALTAVRATLGWSYEALWVVDLAVFGGIVLLVDRLAAWGGATSATRWWVVAGLTFLYPFTTEGIHAQRDVWMSLPALAAVVLRVRRILPHSPSPPLPLFLLALREGALWGCAVWVKPHIVLLAAAAWLMTTYRLAHDTPRPWRTALIDLAGNVAGGLLIGLLGVGFLMATGTWPYFVDVFTVWNKEYTGLIGSELHLRVTQELHWFPPWSLFLLPTLPLAAWSAVGLFTRGDSARFSRGVLGGLYLAWAVQGFFVQRGFQYVHVTETVLMLGLWAAHRWALPALVLGWMLVTSGVWLASDYSPELRERVLTVATPDMEDEHYLVRHPLADSERMKWWPECWRAGMPGAERGRLRDELKYVRNHEASIGWEDLHDVAGFLKSQGARDGEVIGWHDSPHAVYLATGLKPGVRFMHIYTIQMMGPAATARMHAEVVAAAPRVRFVVSDLEMTLLARPDTPRAVIAEPGPTPTDLLPPRLDARHRAAFPYNQPTVFRSGNGRGRYVVHALVNPVGDCTIPVP